MAENKSQISTENASTKKRQRTKIIFITIILGALGSGLWNSCLGPLLLCLGNNLIEIFSIISASYQNGLYKSIARGLHEETSIEIYTTLISGVCTINILLIFYFYFFRKTVLRSIHSAELTSPKETEEKYSEAKKNLHFWLKPIHLIIVYTLILIILFISIGDLYRSLYVNAKITSFNQKFKICRPYIPEEEEEMIISEFSQISNKLDYKNITDKMQKIAEINGISLD